MAQRDTKRALSSPAILRGLNHNPYGERMGRADTRRGSAIVAITATFGGTASVLSYAGYVAKRIQVDQISLP